MRIIRLLSDRVIGGRRTIRAALIERDRPRRVKDLILRDVTVEVALDSSPEEVMEIVRRHVGTQ